KRPLQSSGLHSAGRIVPNPRSAAHSYPRSYLRTWHRKYQRRRLLAVAAATHRRNYEGILRCSEKSTKLTSSAATKVRREGGAENALGGLAGRPRPRRCRWCNGKP